MNFKASFASFALLLSLSSFAAMEKVKISGQLYIAEGFDDNDLVEISFVGVLPNSCYQNPTFDIVRKDNNYKIDIYAQYVSDSGSCRQTNLGYIETISFGMMNAGKYKITLNDKVKPTTHVLTVKEATSGLKDDFTYGNVTGIIENEFDRTIEIVGVNPTSCMKLESVRENIQKSVVVIQPKFIEEGYCKLKPTPFRFSYKVPDLEGHPRGIMLHFRIMDGRSYNYLFQSRK